MRARFLLVGLVASLVMTGCSKNTSGQSTTPATTAPATTAPATAAPALMAQLPIYPGATQQVKGSSGGVGAGSSSGQILRTPDQFSKVYEWYQSKMPARSEKSHISIAGVETALFVLTSGNKHQTVTITRTAADPDTLITLAQASQ